MEPEPEPLVLVDPDATFTGPVDLTSSETDAASSTTSTCSETDEQPQRKTLWNSHEDTTLINAACSGLYASPEEFARNRDDHEDLPGRSAASIRHRSTKLKLRWKKLKAVAEGNLNADDSPSTSPESPDPDYRPLSIKGKATTATSTSTSSAPTTQAGRKTKRARKEKAEDTIAEAKQAVIKAKIEFANQLRKGEEEKRRKAHQQQPSATTTGSAVGSVQQPLQHASVEIGTASFPFWGPLPGCPNPCHPVRAEGAGCWSLLTGTRWLAAVGCCDTKCMCIRGDGGCGNFIQKEGSVARKTLVPK
ncbi:hypothetical protein PAPYR_266 [Paratrimastix pyriformis]|uniref:Myb-like domain-containing protein n=1 Tax=Paratrimastix pyriformis TaxID=342808 RepID=A0ABQ8UX27_9EUKA|nr:hypothetical protein PAPYR_266 [Paratrimastix pyriformis]